MKNIFIVLFLFTVGIGKAQTIKSPSKSIALNFEFDINGKPTYTVTYKNKPVIRKSNLGFKLKDGTDLTSNFSIENSKTSSFNENWNPVLGEQTTIKNQYNELIIFLSQKDTGKKMNIIFRVFDEGAAFRYDFPKQESLNYFIISEEVSEFNLAGNHKVFWIPGDFDSNEYVYNETLFSDIDTQNIELNNGIGMKSIS